MSDPTIIRSFSVHRDIAAYARKAADVLQSSEAFLQRKVDIDHQIDPDGDGEIVIHRDELAITANNLAHAVKFLRLLAEFETEGGA